MANINRAMGWLKTGKKIRKSNWQKKSYWYMEDDFSIMYSDRTKAVIHPNQILANDWEIWEEENSAQFLQRIGIDGQKWAQEFMKLFENKREEIDEGLMIGWFCNAIIAGFDEKARRIKREEEIEQIIKQAFGDKS